MMRRLILAAVAVVALASAGLLGGSRAEAMSLPGGLAASGQTEQVRLVCSRVWNGYAWVRSCYESRPRYYAPRAYYAPRPYYGRRHYRSRYY